ncbi:7676_t:CDS:1 [Ambispora gerdemannii]|uniref:7676_t:CDS:1 n=1 Tax=Ambispora gerdemannii TaxID=144530 RepID=A0A9N8V7I1_9GLOM|nr:7676_t:CDS:1 [Ambispora gerdemannii]
MNSNNNNTLRYFYSVNDATTRLDKLYQMEQHNESADIRSDFVDGSYLPILNEKNVLLDPDCSFVSDIPIIEIEFIPDLPNLSTIGNDNELTQVDQHLEDQQDEDSQAHHPNHKHIISRKAHFAKYSQANNKKFFCSKSLWFKFLLF